MRMTILIVASTVVSLIAIGGSAGLADELPEEAKAVSSAELRKLYSGKTANWSSNIRAYFAADRSVKGFNLDGGATYTGKWTVSGNEVCMRVKWKALKSSESGTAKDCWKWYKSGKTLWTLWSTRYDGKKPKSNDYYTSEAKTLKSGDLVSKRYAQLNKQ